MKRWAGLLLVLVAAAVVALVISVRVRPSEWQRRHAMIRNGMTTDEVAEIMGQRQSVPVIRRRPPQAAFVWEYRPAKQFLTRDVRLEVHFGADSRVVRTTVDGVQVEPPYKWGNP